MEDIHITTREIEVNDEGGFILHKSSQELNSSDSENENTDEIMIETDIELGHPVCFGFKDPTAVRAAVVILFCFICIAIGVPLIFIIIYIS
jgi:hypothetical protein